MFNKIHQGRTAVARLLLAALPSLFAGGGLVSSFASPYPSGAVAPEVSVSPGSVNFGEVTVGSQGTDVVTITNSSGQPMIVSAVAVTGGDFDTTGLSLPLDIPSGASSEFRVQFTPQSPGNAVGSLAIVSNVIPTPQRLPLLGTGVTRHLSMSPASIDFGELTAGRRTTRTLTVRNAGTAKVTITEIKAAGPGFEVSAPPLPLGLAAGQTATLEATFVPVEGDKATGSISVGSDASESLNSVPLTGKNTVGQLTASPPRVGFGSMPLGSTSTQAVVLTDTGTAAVNITNASVTGSGFSISGLQLPVTLQPGSSTSFNAVFDPNTAGNTTGSISLTSDAKKSPTSVTLTGMGLSLQLSASPGSVNFGNVTVGSSSAQTVTLTNTGTAGVTVSQATVTGTGFAVSGLTVPLTLAAGQSTSFSATFAPGSAGSASGSISITSNATNSPTSVALSGTGVTLQLAASPNSVGFGNVTVGTASTQAVTLTNTGTGSVTVSQASVTGTGFTTSGLTLPLTLAAGQSASFNAVFSPTTAGNASGNISVVSNATNSPASVALSGTGVSLQLSASPSSVNFGNVGVGTTGTQSITLTNSGTGSVTVTQATVTGTGFSSSGLTLPLTVAGGQSANFNALFSPATTGSASGNISLASNASNSPTSIALSGTAVTLQLSAVPSSVSFGNVVLGSSSSQTVVVTNTGTAAVTISQLNVTGAGFSASGFALPLTLAAGANASLSAVFSPTSTGTASGTIGIVSNATGSPTNVSLSGSGVNSHSVSLSWTASNSSNISGYNVYRGSMSGGPYTQLNLSLVASTTYTDTTVLAGQTYYYVTTAVNSSNQESGNSNEAQAAIPDP